MHMRFPLFVSAVDDWSALNMQIHLWLQLIMILLGYLKLYPRQTGLTVAFPRVSEGLWKYGVVWDLALATLLCLRVFDVAFMMVYLYLGVFLGVSMEPERIYGSSVVQLLPTILLVSTIHVND